MIKKSLFADELMAGMQKKLAESEVTENLNALPNAVEYINSAIDILEEEGMQTQANTLLSILLKIAQVHRRQKPKDPRHIPDRYTPKSSEEMVKNLLEHGTMFNNSDDGNDLLNADVDESLEVEENKAPTLETFEDEKD